MDPTVERLNILNIYWQIWKEKDNTVIAGTSTMVRSSRQNRNKIRLEPCFRPMALTDIYRIFHPTAAEFTFFPTAHRTFSRIDCMVGHKASHSKFKYTKYLFQTQQCETRNQ